MNISSKQRQILKVLKAGGIISAINRRKRNLRLLDANKNPLKYVHKRTFNALMQKQLVIKISQTTFSCLGADKNNFLQEATEQKEAKQLNLL